MLTIVATKTMQNWLETNLSKYAVNTNNKNITKQYQTTTSKGEKFIIKLYTSGTLTIEGNISERIYTSLIQNCGEENYVGCDEVGVGDFLGPTVYVSVKIDQNAIEAISKTAYPIRDSKKLSDDQIKEIYQTLVHDVEHHSQIVYDSQLEPGLNSIAQKVNYHFENVFDYEQEIVVVDLFTTENAFYKYSSELHCEWPTNLILETKADGKYLSVALASIFARAIFLGEMAKLEAKYGMRLQLGAGAPAKECGQQVIRQHSKAELATFAKTTFKTFNELI